LKRKWDGEAVWEMPDENRNDDSKDEIVESAPPAKRARTNK
jgi:hypothetical protein